MLARVDTLNLTIFTIPKPFRGHIGMIQRNAIRSWTLLEPRPEVLLFGDEEGTAQVARELGVSHVPQIERNELGTPVAATMFSEAQRRATHDIVAYFNGDIVAMGDFTDALCTTLAWRKECMITGNRRDLDVHEPLQFTEDWQSRLRDRVAREATVHNPSGTDYFVFPRGLLDSVPAFAIGRPPLGSWLLWYAQRVRKVPIVDISEAAVLVHQTHDYNHHSAGETGVWKGVEAARNLALSGGYRTAFTLRDADYHTTPQGVVPWRTPYATFCRAYRWLVTDSGMYPIVRPLAVGARAVLALARRQRLPW